MSTLLTIIIAVHIDLVPVCMVALMPPPVCYIIPEVVCLNSKSNCIYMLAVEVTPLPTCEVHMLMHLVKARWFLRFSC